MRKSFFAALLLVPAVAFAFDYSDSADRYADHDDFSTAEHAAIAVLTNLGVVEGNPDGTFRAHRTLNRAEFLKIALLSVYSEEELAGEEDWCFPDVHDDEWFSRHVCLAKKKGIVQGYPDGLFHPEREVNYVEALKMLVELYDYELPESGGEWYTRYVDAARMHRVTFSPEPRFGEFVVRGEMARLAAAFRAEADGELDLYRALERGEEITSSSSSISSNSSIASISSPASSESSASSASSTFALPATSHIILIDRKSPPFADGTFLYADQEVIIREVRLKLKKRVKSFSELYMVDAAGQELLALRINTSGCTPNTDGTCTTNYEHWYATPEADKGPHLPKNQSTTFAFTGLLRPWGQGGVSGEMIEVERISLIVQSLDGTSSWEIVPTVSHFPRIQTAQTLLSKITNAGDAAGTLTAGTNAMVARFSFSGALATGASILDVNQLTLRVNAVGATIANPKIGRSGGTGTSACGLTGDIITCTTLPADAHDASHGLQLEVRADVAYVGQGVHTVQLVIDDPGTIDVPGAVQWFDGTTNFSWIEAPKPVTQGTNWTVVKP